MSAILALETGQIFKGRSIGVEGIKVGEVVFNTAMTGYEEVITDPSYANQIITFTYPHIGNTGINNEDSESDRVWAKGVIVRSLMEQPSNWRSKLSLPEYFQQQQVVGISDIDTRALTHLLRQAGSLKGCIMAGGEVNESFAVTAAKQFVGLQGINLAKEVTTTQPYTFSEGRATSSTSYPVVVLDFGVKKSILRQLQDRGCQVMVVPADTSYENILALKPKGILLSNGPGDPEACHENIQTIKRLTHLSIPIFGICLGCQLLALAFDLKTYKMKYGHHGGNHPVQDLMSKKVLITSQNHGFAIAEQSLGSEIQATHRSLFDQSLQGIRHKIKPFFGFQGHPEAGPGPQDAFSLFDEFLLSVKEYQEPTIVKSKPVTEDQIYA